MISTHYLTPKKHSPLETWQREPKLVNVLYCTRMLQQGVQHGRSMLHAMLRGK